MATTPARDVGRADVIEQLGQPISGVVSTHRPNRLIYTASRNVTLPVRQSATNKLYRKQCQQWAAFFSRRRH